MLVAIGLVYLIMVILFRSLLVPLVILFALLLAVIGGFVVLDVSLQPAPLPVTVSAAGMWIAYSISGGLYGVALAAAAMLSAVMLTMAGNRGRGELLRPLHRQRRRDRRDGQATARGAHHQPSRRSQAPGVLSRHGIRFRPAPQTAASATTLPA
jgi:hypothetical protein